MISWIESQSVAIIVVVGYALCFGIAALVVTLGATLAKTRSAASLQLVSPGMVTVMGVLLGLLLAFLSSRVWTNVDRANSFVAAEASGVRELVRQSELLPPAVSGTVRGGVDNYLRWVTGEDWPQMMSGAARLPIKIIGLGDAAAALTAFETASSGERSVQQAALNALEKIREARRGRILLSRNSIGVGQWLVVVVLFVHVLMLLGTIHIRHLGSMIVAIGIFSSAFAVCLVLLLMYDRPFRHGGLTVEPVGIEELIDH